MPMRWTVDPQDETACLTIRLKSLMDRMEGWGVFW